MGEGVALVRNAALGNRRVPPSTGGLACNPTYFSAVSQAVTVPNILVSILWSFYIMGSVKPVLVVLEACVIG